MKRLRATLDENWAGVSVFLVAGVTLEDMEHARDENHRIQSLPDNLGLERYGSH
jgi:hypothetical protein